MRPAIVSLILFASVSVAAATFPQPSAPPAAKSPQPAPGALPTPGPIQEMKDMAWLAGHWDVTTTYFAPGGQQYTGHTESLIEPMLDGCFLQERIKVPMGKFDNSMIGVRSFDRFRKVYRIVWFDSVITLADVYEGTFAGDDLTVSNVRSGTSVMLPGSPETFVRFTQRPAGHDRFALVWEASTDGGKTWRKSAEYQYRRKP